MLTASLRKSQRDCDYPQRVDCVSDIDLDMLWANEKRGIILDLDNTLVSEDDEYLSPAIMSWLEQAKLRGFRLFILSNSKRQRRLRYWESYFDIPAIGASKKPFSQNFNRAILALGLPKHQVLVIGDSLHTDGLGARLVGCSWVQVASIPHMLHWWEKIIGTHLHIPYPENRLDDLQLIEP